MQELGEAKADVPLHKADLINEIKCQIQHGIYQAIKDPQYRGAANPGRSIEWILTWTVKVDLQMTVDDKGTFGPGVTLTTPFVKPVESFSLGLGVQSSSEASHKEETGFSYNIGDLYKITDREATERKIDPWKPCGGENGTFINSDLKIEKFIQDNLFLARAPGVIYDPFNAFNDTVQFIIIYGGSVTPSWKLVRFSINPSSPFLGAMRTRTQYLTLTFGPPPSPPTVAPSRIVPPASAAVELGAPQLNSTAEAVHQSNLIGQAVLGAIRSNLQQ